jgi:hypothetical protein
MAVMEAIANSSVAIRGDMERAKLIMFFAKSLNVDNMADCISFSFCSVFQIPAKSRHEGKTPHAYF